MLQLAHWTSRGQQQKGQPHPRPQPWTDPAKVEISGDTVKITTGQSVFPPPPCNPPEPCDPFSNLLPTVYSNVYDSSGQQPVENTLPSTPAIPYNLHDGEPKISIINSSGNPLNTPSPQDDLKAFAIAILKGAQARNDKNIRKSIQGALDVLEGNPTKVPRAYSGLPLLHYKAGEKVKKVDGATANVDVHQVWYDTHIESDTAYLDVRDVRDKIWTVTYTVDVLNRGHDDFSPFAMFLDPTAAGKCPGFPPTMPCPFMAMDQSFFNMEDGTRTVFKIKMPPGRYFNLVYTWGWRAHPPRVQAMENACKSIPFAPPPGPEVVDCGTVANTLPWYERQVFFNNGKPDKSYAISKLSKYAPEMRIWTALHDALDALNAKPPNYSAIIKLFHLDWEQGQRGVAREAWEDWRDRTKLPHNLPPTVMKQMDAETKNKETDLFLFYLANTIYAHFANGSRMDFPDWTKRGQEFKVTLFNGDYFDHGYQNVDFGGARGWENQFKSSVKVGGSGCWFTFGRVWWTMNIPPMPFMNEPIKATLTVPAAKRAATRDGEDQFGVRKVHMVLNYEPSRRLRIYQFDPVHHDVAVFSIH
jgi:hypothetical protein